MIAILTYHLHKSLSLVIFIDGTQMTISKLECATKLKTDAC